MRDVDADTRNRAVLHLIDWMGCTIAGRQTDIGRIFRAGDPLSEHVSDPGFYAFAYGSLGSILEMDDVHRTALLHPGPVVIPAALAFSGEEEPGLLLDAIIAGYDAMIRIGRSVGPAHYARFHNTGTCGGAGAAIAAARILGLNSTQKIWALGNAMTTASGLWQCRNEPVFTKPLHVAEASRRGALAAFYASRGLSGPSFIFEGPQGFFAAMAGDGDPDTIVSEPDAPWLIHDVSFKPWPACRHAHAAIDAAMILKDQTSTEAIKSIRIQTYADAVRFCDKPNPTTTGEAKFSLQHAVALVFAKGIPQLDDFDPAGIAAKSTTALRDLTQVEENSEFTNAYPAHFGARVQIELANGSHLSTTVTDALGDRENPMSENAIVNKFFTLCTWSGLSESHQHELVDLAQSLLAGHNAFKLKKALSSVL